MNQPQIHEDLLKEQVDRDKKSNIKLFEVAEKLFKNIDKTLNDVEERLDKLEKADANNEAYWDGRLKDEEQVEEHSKNE